VKDAYGNAGVGTAMARAGFFWRLLIGVLSRFFIRINVCG